MPPGTVEILVCDNASTDGTWELIAQVQATHPELRAFRNKENMGFDLNYLRCVEEANGEFVWVMGDDDVWNPGAVPRVLRELDAGADACLCLAEACDLEMNPIIVLPWYLDPEPPRVWHLLDRKDLIRYFDACARNAGVFAFISVSIINRDRFLLHRESVQKGIGTGYPQLWGMMELFRQPMNLHYIPEVLVRNRMSDLHTDSFANTNLFYRWMQDLVAWEKVADGVFGDDSEVSASFFRILGRNHHDTILPGLRRQAPSEPHWLQAVPYLIRAGFSPIRVATVDFAFHHMNGDRLPMATLNPDALCLVDLPLVARGAKHIAILVLGGLQHLLAGSGLLATLRNARGAERIRIYCTPECEELLDGFQIHCLDPKRYTTDKPYQEITAQSLIDYAPELVVNLDPQRGMASDDLVAAALPAGAIAYELTESGQDAELIHALNGHYVSLIPRGAGPKAMLEALGLKGIPEALWPAPVAMEEAQSVLRGLGWDPAKTLAVLVDHPSILEEPTFQSALAEAGNDGWTLVGIGGQGTYQALETLLAPWEDRAVNLAGGLRLSSMAALLKLCGASLGGTPLLRAMAGACACAPYAPGTHAKIG